MVERGAFNSEVMGSSPIAVSRKLQYIWLHSSSRLGRHIFTVKTSVQI